MTTVPFEKIWQAQCDAARTIKARYGDAAAFDYLVGEKLLHFVSAAARRPEFAGQLPSFVSEIRKIFGADELPARLYVLEQRLEAEAGEQNEANDEMPTSARSDLAYLRQVSDLLLSRQLGTA